MKLELKHICPYLPYGLKGVLTSDLREEFSEYDFENIEIFNKGNIWQYAGYADKDLNIPMGEGEINGFIYRNGHAYGSFHYGIRPLLRTLSDYQDINSPAMNDLNCDLWDQMAISDLADKSLSLSNVRYAAIEIMASAHIDFNNLIEQNLAIDINTLSK